MIEFDADLSSDSSIGMSDDDTDSIEDGKIMGAIEGNGRSVLLRESNVSGKYGLNKYEQENTECYYRIGEQYGPKARTWLRQQHMYEGSGSRDL